MTSQSDRKLFIVAAAIALLSVAVTGCATDGVTLPPPTKEDKVAAAKVCDKIVEPPRVTFDTVTFHPLPKGTIAEGGVEVVAGLTKDGVANTVGNMQKNKERELQWRVRAKAINTCIDDVASDAAIRLLK